MENTQNANQVTATGSGAQNTQTPQNKAFNPRNRSMGPNQNRNSKFKKRPFKKQTEFSEQVVSINRVTKVTKGGRKLKFAALVVIGNKKGKVGFATGKANEVPDAIKKAIKEAHKNLIEVPIVDNTIPHKVIGHFGASRVMIKPANSGIGIISGGPSRLIMELSGVKNVYTKSFGSNHPINMIRATVNGLLQLKTKAYFDHMRDKTPVPVVEEPPISNEKGEENETTQSADQQQTH